MLLAPGGRANRVVASPQDVLFDQRNQPGGNSVRSTNGNIDAQDSQIADDFTLTCTGSCTIQSVFADGRYQGSPQTSPSELLVQIYDDPEGGVPGNLIAEWIVPPAQFTDISGDYNITLNPPLVLGAGTWWVSVQATINSNFYTWTWDDRSDNPSPFPSLYDSVYRGHPSGFAPQCTNWQPRVDVCEIPSATAAPDMLFEIDGVGTGDNVTPHITRLIPPYVPPGSGDINPFRVRGYGFSSDSVVNWDSVPVSTTFNINNPAELNIVVPSAWLTTRDLVAITVFNPPPYVSGHSGLSNMKYFLIGQPVFLPVIRR
jgi:hypothetical protein